MEAASRSCIASCEQLLDFSAPLLTPTNDHDWWETTWFQSILPAKVPTQHEHDAVLHYKASAPVEIVLSAQLGVLVLFTDVC